MVPHRIPSRWERENDRKTPELWKLFFGPTISFAPDNRRTVELFYQSHLSSNLVAAVEDYRIFCRQVALPHYRDDRFLETALYCYRNDAISGDFSKTAFPYHKAFIWKTHMLNPIDYSKDEDEVNKEICDKVDFQKHQVRKKISYKEDSNLAVGGAMFRGNVTPIIPLPNIEDITKNHSSNLKLFQITSYHLEGLERHCRYHIYIMGIIQNTRQEKTLIDIEEVGRESSLYRSLQEDNIFEVNPMEITNLKLVLVELAQNGYLEDKYVYVMNLPFSPCVDFRNGEQKKIILDFRDRYQPTKRGWITFTQLKSNFSDGLVLRYLNNTIHSHSNYCQVLKVPELMAPYSLKHEDTPCSYMDLDIVDNTKIPVLQCRVLKTHLGDFASVEICDLKDRLFASAYTIGKESLPSIRQVSKPDKCCIFRGNSETVYVIRSTNYDWGLLKVFTDNNMPNKILFLNLKVPNQSWEQIYNFSDNTSTVSYGYQTTGMSLDINRCTISLPLKQKYFPEMLALGSAIIALFLQESLN